MLAIINQHIDIAVTRGAPATLRARALLGGKAADIDLDDGGTQVVAQPGVVPLGEGGLLVAPRTVREVQPLCRPPRRVVVAQEQQRASQRARSEPRGVPRTLQVDGGVA